MRLKTLLFYVAILGVWGLIYSQTCQLRGPTAAGENSGIKCLNLSEIDGSTINVPSNVTVISQDGLSLCPFETVNQAVPAVVIIMDQSASMNKDWPGQPMGDPYGYRSKIARDALSYLYEASAVGWFSYIEFGSDIKSELKQNDSNCPAGINAGATHLIAQDFIQYTPATMALWLNELQSPIQNRCFSGTNYHSPMEEAKRYINNFDPGDLNVDFSVIFISDGRPNDSLKPFDVIKENYRPVPGKFPPIHGIFINENPQAQGDVLARLATATGGSSYMVRGSDTASLNTVMRNITSTIIRRSNPDGLIIENGGNSYTAASVKQDGGGGFQTNFSTPIPLNAGINSLVFNVAFKDEEGIVRNRVISFKINVSGQAAPEGIAPTNNYFVAECAVYNNLKINNYDNPKLVPGAGYAATPKISTQSSKKVDILLTAATYKGDSSGIFTLTSKRTGDVLQIQFPQTKKPGEYKGKAPLLVAGLNGMGRPITTNKNDSTLLVAAFDTLLVDWVNPQDPRDLMSASLLVYDKPQVSFEGDTLGIDQIIVNIEDAAALGVEAAYTLYWSNGLPVGAKTALRTGSSAKFSSISDWQNQLQIALDSHLVVNYLDPLFKEIYSDTVALRFRVPMMPRAWLADLDGDGRADQLTLSYSSEIPADQHFGNLRLVWGANDEDTLFLKIDSLNPAWTDFVTVKENNGMTQWILDLPQPLPFGHTNGSGVSGAGSLMLSGSFDGRATQRILPVEDRVGPVVLEMWVDPENIDISYLRASEPLGPSASNDWFLVLRSGEFESKRTNNDVKTKKSNIYTITLVSNVDNRILSGDSVRFLPEMQGGVRDLNNIGAHENNPYVKVSGYREPISKVNISISDPLVDLNKLANLPPPADSLDIETQFRVLLGSKDQGSYKDMHTGDQISPKDLQGTMLINVSVQLPMLNGLDGDGVPLEGFLIDGEMAWSTEIKVTTHFFDQLGQFICEKTAKLVIDDPSQIGAEGQAQFSLLWQPDKIKGLTTQQGRAVASGVIIAKITTTSVSTALKELAVYDEDGELSKRSISVDSKRKTKEVVAKKIGYLRK